MKQIFLNSDVGEEAGFDSEIMPYISLCNIACGVHAGNEKVIRETIDLALKHDVKIGAHPSYPDRDNFGRVVMDISEDELEASIYSQIETMKYWIEKAGGVLHHVKPHGALYNEVVRDKSLAAIVIRLLKNIDKSLYLIAPKESEISYLSKGVLRVQYEVFADRNYHNDFSLVSRTEKNAVLDVPEEVLDHVLRMVSDKEVRAITGERLPISFDTICVHGDTRGAVQVLECIYKELLGLGYVV